MFGLESDRHTALIYEQEPEPALVILEYRPPAPIPNLDAESPDPTSPAETRFAGR